MALAATRRVETIEAKLRDLKGGLLKDSPIFQPGTDAALEQRYSKPAKVVHNITFEFTEDPNLLKQYYKIRGDAYLDTYRSMGKTPPEGVDFYAGEVLDVGTKILVIKNGNTCVGGVKFTISRTGNRHILPLEEHGPSLDTLFPGLYESGLVVAEINKLCMLPEYRVGGFGDSLARIIVLVSRDIGIDLLFLTTPLDIQYRRYKRAFALCDFDLIQLPNREYEYYGLNLKLSYVNVSSCSFEKRRTPVREFFPLLVEDVAYA